MPAERLVRSTTRDALRYLIAAVSVLVALLCAFAASLRLLTCECLVSNLLALVALDRSLTLLEHSRVCRLPRYVEVLTL